MVNDGLKLRCVARAENYFVKIAVYGTLPENILEGDSYSFEKIGLSNEMHFKIYLFVIVIIAYMALMGYIATFTHK